MNKKERAALSLLAMQRHSWEQGTAMQAFLEWGRMDVVVSMAHEAVYRAMEDGRAATIGVTDAITDPCSVGEALIAACELTHDPMLEEGRDRLLVWALQKAARNPDGVLYHLNTSKQFWADSMYMLPPFLAAAGYVEEALTNFYGYWNALFDEKAALMCHMWDDEKGVYIREAHWGGANGWALASMARMIGLLPEAGYGEDIERIKHMAVTLLEGVTRYMRDDGLYHDVVDDPESFAETNLSQMTAYTIYRGIAEGWLDEAWKKKADHMRLAANEKVNEFGFVAGVCGAPTFDKPGFSPEGQAFYLLMETAAERMEKRKRTHCIPY